MINEWQKENALQGGRVAQRITRLTTDQKIAGSNPAEIEILLFFIKVTNIQKRNVPRRKYSKFVVFNVNCNSKIAKNSSILA